MEEITASFWHALYLHFQHLPYARYCEMRDIILSNDACVMCFPTLHAPSYAIIQKQDDHMVVLEVCPNFRWAKYPKVYLRMLEIVCEKIGCKAIRTGSTRPGTAKMLEKYGFKGYHVPWSNVPEYARFL